MSLFVSLEMLQQRITENKLIHLSPEGTPEQQKEFLQQVIARAQSLVESYITEQYQEPLVSIPPLIQEWTFCIAEYELCKRSPSSRTPEKIRESYENTLNQLRDLSKGLLRLPGVERKSTAVNSSLAIAPSSGESVFSMMLQDS